MSLTDEQQDKIFRQSFNLIDTRLLPEQRVFCRAIESAATAPLLERIKELERQLEQASPSPDPEDRRHLWNGSPWPNYVVTLEENTTDEPRPGVGSI
jgi:hypothetical protein